MVDIVPTNTTPGVPAGNSFDAAEAITVWDVVYGLADGVSAGIADCTDSAKINVVGIALRSVASGETVIVARDGDTLDTGVATTKGSPYYLSETGGIMPVADLTTGDYVVRVGIGAETANHLTLDIKNYGYQHA